jgi:hypothetical protein
MRPKSKSSAVVGGAAAEANAGDEADDGTGVHCRGTLASGSGAPSAVIASVSPPRPAPPQHVVSLSSVSASAAATATASAPVFVCGFFFVTRAAGFRAAAAKSIDICLLCFLFCVLCFVFFAVCLQVLFTLNAPKKRKT